MTGMWSLTFVCCVLGCSWPQPLTPRIGEGDCSVSRWFCSRLSLVRQGATMGLGLEKCVLFAIAGVSDSATGNTGGKSYRGEGGGREWIH